MNTEEKIKLYEELHPKGKQFPQTKKPEEKPEDMQWLDEKIAEFQAIKDKKTENSDQNLDQNLDPEVQSASPTISEAPEQKKAVKVYTVDQIKCLPEEEFKKIEDAVKAGLARVDNH